MPEDTASVSAVRRRTSAVPEAIWRVQGWVLQLDGAVAAIVIARSISARSTGRGRKARTARLRPAMVSNWSRSRIAVAMLQSRTGSQAHRYEETRVGKKCDNTGTYRGVAD